MLKIMKNLTDYQIAIIASKIYRDAINSRKFSKYWALCRCFKMVVEEILGKENEYKHSLFTYGNALKFNTLKNIQYEHIEVWWYLDNTTSRLKFLDWIIENS